MKKNYYRLIDGDCLTIATYYGTKSNANAYFLRFCEKLPSPNFLFPLKVFTYNTLEDMMLAQNSVSLTVLVD